MRRHPTLNAKVEALSRGHHLFSVRDAVDGDMHGDEHVQDYSVPADGLPSTPAISLVSTTG